MPIGKNALKRVENNGYSKVASNAPDMENSVVVETEVPAKVAKPATKSKAKKTVESVPAPKKTTKTNTSTATKKAEEVVGTPAKAVEKKPAAPKAPKARKKAAKQPASAVAVGSDLPYYLL